MTAESSPRSQDAKDTQPPGVDLSTDEDDGRGWTPKLFLALFVIVMLGELTAFSYNLVATALPGIGAKFEADNLGWVITIPTLVSAVAMAFIGKLADLKGKRLVLITISALSAVGAVVSAMAPTYEIFLLGRGLQGLMFIAPALGYSLIRDIFPKKLIAFAATVTFTGFGATFIFAPLLAGWLIDNYGAVSIFWFVAIYLAVCLVGAVLFVPESPLRVKSKLDWVGALLLGAGGAFIIYGLGEANKWGWTSITFFAFMVLGVVCMVAWLKWDSRFSDPLIEIPLLKSRPVWTTVLVGGTIYATAGIVSSIVPSMVQTPREIGGTYGFGTDAMGVAVYLVPLGTAMVVSGLLCGSMARRWGIRVPVRIGCILLALGAGSLALWHSESWHVAVALVLFGAGMGATYGGLPNLVIQAVPPEKQGISAAIANVAQNLGTSMLIQIVFGVLAGHLIVSSVGAFYTSDGYTIAYAIAGICAVVSFLVTFLIPHGGVQGVRNVRTGGDVAAVH
ncbi:MFS transporter [Williamsia soli]|uniref:MFS transporter n=1 Tax=Williamsia soli TaxID=364929 RepID=UPI001A9E9B36|nr:MFS transporter [Williamsia soli]